MKLKCFQRLKIPTWNSISPNINLLKHCSERTTYRLFRPDKHLKILQSVVFLQNTDRVTTRVLGLYTSCNVVIPSHDRQKLKLHSAPSETLDTINLDFLSSFPKYSAYIRTDRPNHKISRGRIDDKYLCQEICFWARTAVF